MKQRDHLKRGRDATELIEEAIHLLRNARAGTFAAYYTGTLPFALGLLYFWSDMARSPFAPGHLADASLELAVLFLWMKFWQAVFALNLRAQLTGAPTPGLDFARCCRIFVAQTAIQPSGLFLLPLALIPAIPFPWIYAFYQNATALGDAGPGGPAQLCKNAWRQGILWPRQNNVAIFILSGFAFCVFLNWAVVGYALPHLAKMLFGIESVFTRGGTAFLNSTYFAAMFTVTYLSVDPILKAVYTLRCFYGDSVTSGEDLKAELKQSGALRGAAACLTLAILLAGARQVHADETAPPAPSPPQAISAPALNKAIEQTIGQTKYTWRMPREKIADTDESPGILGRFLDRVSAMLRRWAKAAVEWLARWLQKMLPREHHFDGGDNSGYGWIMSLEILLYTLLAAVAAALALMIYRAIRNRRKSAVITAEAIQPAPDLTDENVGADQLPEDGWTRLARELLARGELRLALRAFYLASLAHLAERNLISLARFKSNRDYERELRRRAHALPALVGVFGENIAVFDRIWYGMHDVTGELVSDFAANVERLRGVP